MGLLLAALPSIPIRSFAMTLLRQRMLEDMGPQRSSELTPSLLTKWTQ